MKKNRIKKTVMLILVMALSFSFMGTTTVSAGTEPYIGEIVMFAGNFAPRGWAFCDGQILSIAQNTALFSILGTTYGGNGQTTFALPDLRGRVPVQQGQGPGLYPINLGEMAGSEKNTLLTTQMPAHVHTIAANTEEGTTSTPGTNVYLAKANTPDRQEVNIYTTNAPDTTLSYNSTGISGANQPVNNMQPYLGINFIIATEGIFPPHP